VSDLSDTAGLTPTQHSPTQSALNHIDHAQQFVPSKEYDEAIAIRNAEIKSDHTSVRVYHLRGYALMRLTQHLRAIADFTAAIELRICPGARLARASRCAIIARTGLISCRCLQEPRGCPSEP